MINAGINTLYYFMAITHKAYIHYCKPYTIVNHAVQANLDNQCGHMVRIAAITL